VTYTVIAQIAPNVNGTLTNTANVAVAAANATDPALANNSATDVDTILLQTFTGLSATGTGVIVAIVTGGGGTCSFLNPQFIGPPPGAAPIPPSTPPIDDTDRAPRPHWVFPEGLFDFTLQGCAVGSTATITITYPDNIVGASSYWKYGPTAGGT